MQARTAFSARLKQWFAPSCLLCDAISDSELSLCIGCQQDLPWLLHSCERCGIPLEDATLLVCPECLESPPVVDKVICALHYATPVDYLIKRMKFAHQLACAKVLGELLSQHLSQQNFDRPDAVLPVPLHKARLRTRGFNQTLELYREINKQLPIPLFKGIKRIKNTRHQTMVKGDERTQNLQGAFAITESSIPKHIVILDDVITTGATTNTLAQQLKDAGAERISVWAVSRATERRN